MQTHEEGGSAFPHGGRGTEAQSSPVPHRPKLVDGDRTPCTTDHQAERVSRQEPHDDDMDRAPGTTHRPEDPGLGPLGESRAATGRRISFKTFSEPSRSPERALPSKPPGSAESIEPASSARGRRASDSSERVARVTSQALGFSVLTPHPRPLPSKPPGSAESVELAASALGRRAQDKPGRSVFHATQLRSSPSDLPAPGLDEKVMESVFKPRTIPLQPDLARTRGIAASHAASRDLFPPTRAHDAIISVPESHDDELDFSMEPASLTAVAANDGSAGKFRTAARFNTAVRGADAAARERFPAFRPQDGTQDFNIESTSLVAVGTSRYPSSSSTASSVATAVRKSDAVAYEDSPTPRSQDGTLDVGIAPALPAAVPTRVASAEIFSTAASLDAGVK